MFIKFFGKILILSAGINLVANTTSNIKSFKFNKLKT